MNSKLMATLAATLLIAACSGDNNENSNTNGGDDMSVANNETDTGANNTTPDTGTPNNTTPDTGTTDPDTGTTDPDTGTTDPDMGPSRLDAHGCTYATATDMTGSATVNITDIGAWAVGHEVCIIVDAGTVVSWTGNFTLHPLDGGVSPTADAANPIDIAGSAASGDATVDVTLDAAGDYPYYCGIHTTSMRGVVYVD